MTFDEGTNILYGDNAQGKTNILEAAYVSGTTKSHKGSRDKEMIRFGQDRISYQDAGGKERKGISDRYPPEEKYSAKGIAINKVPIKKASELFGILNIVFFSPEDLNIIKNGPAERRRFMDAELCQLDKIYLSDLTKYNKILNAAEQTFKRYCIISPESEGDTSGLGYAACSNYGKKIIAPKKTVYQWN